MFFVLQKSPVKVKKEKRRFFPMLRELESVSETDHLW